MLRPRRSQDGLDVVAAKRFAITARDEPKVQQPIVRVIGVWVVAPTALFAFSRYVAPFIGPTACRVGLALRGLLFRFGAFGDVRRRGEGPDRAAS